MNFLRRIMLISIMIFFVGVNIQKSYAQNTILCSTTLRDELSRMDKDTYKILYNITDSLLIKYINKNYDNFDLNKTISGEPLWYDNKKGGCNNLGQFILGSYNLEVQNWNAFWNNYGSIAGVVNSNELSKNTVLSMQNYIKDHCGFDMGVDGQLGKKTINSINICKPPALGYMSWNEFKSSHAKFYHDEQGTKIIYTGNDFKEDPTQKLFIKQADLGVLKTGPGLGLVKEVATGSCAEKFGSFYSQVQNDVKLEGTNCCYFGNKDGKTVGVTSPNADQWSINGTNAIYSPILNTQATPIVIQNNTSSITVPLCNTITSNNTCRFAEPKNDNDKSTYTAALADEKNYIKGSCSTGCPNNTKEVMKGGSSVCEICDIEKCNCGIKLNTYVPFIGRCIVNKQDNNSSLSGGVTTVNSLNAFPILMGALIKLLMSIIMILCFASLIVGGFMMTIPDQYETGKGLVKKVVWTIVALGSLGTILYLINPNFFT